MLILSLKTIPSRWDHLQKVIDSILSQTIYDKVNFFYINIDDNISQELIEKYKTLESKDSKIKIQICESKWRSASKLIQTYQKHHNDVIVTFDDDIINPKECLEQLYNEHLKNPECIISQQANPIRNSNNSVSFINTVNLKLKQRAFAKYLSHACLFPPNCFSDLLYDYETFYKLTHAMHDEIWFWIVSTLNGIYNIDLNYTYTYGLDDIELQKDDFALSKTNCKTDEINAYNLRITQMFGVQLKEIFNKYPIIFDINNDNILAFCGNITLAYNLFQNFNIELRCNKTIVKSWQIYLINKLKQIGWCNKIKVYII